MNTQLKDLFPFCCEAVNQQKQKQFEFSLNERIKNTINAHSILRQLGEIKILEPGEQAKYTLPKTKDKEIKFHFLPNLGICPTVLIETPGEEIYLPTFTLATSCDIDMKYVENQRIDILDKCITTVTRQLIADEESCLLRLLIPAATFNNKLNKKLKPKVYTSFSEKVALDLFKSFKKERKTLTHILLSTEESSDLRNIKENTDNCSLSISIIEAPRHIIITDSGIDYKIELVKMNQLGALGQFNINSKESTYGIMRLNDSNIFNDYKPKKPNKVSAKGADLILETIGETQVYGLCVENKNSFIKIPIKQEFQLWPDPSLHRQHRLGYYGWEEIGCAILDPTCVKMAVIDRSK